MPAPRKPAAPVKRDVSWWRRDQQRGLAIVVALVVVLGSLLAGYGVQVQIADEAARKANRAAQTAMATKEDLRTGSVLHVPMEGNVCRQRWIDNATWQVSNEGTDVDCDEASNPTASTSAQQVGARMEAVRGGFGR